MSNPNVVSWTSLIAGYIECGEPEKGLNLFETMCRRSIVVPNSFTYSAVVNACSFLADIQSGEKIHARIERLGFQSCVVIGTALINMYGKSNDVAKARRVFDTMAYRNVVSWSSVISVYAQNALGNDALALFGEFIQTVSESPNEFMFSSVISACASLGRLGTGRVAHGAVIRLGYANDVVAGALVDMYAKCGCIGYSDKVFRRIRKPCVIPYTSMIVATAKHGLGKLSLELFKEMLEKGIRPNNVTMIGVLYACSHSGLVDIGLEHLNSMQAKHGIEPNAKHYTCIVDMLGRVGRVDEAHNLAKNTPMDTNDATLLWASLLSASRIHSRLDIAIEAGQRLIELNQQLASVYVTMSNTFASAGEWERVHGLRRTMKQQGLQKEPGCSWVEIKDRTYLFYAGELSRCERVSEVMSLLRELEMRMKERGHVSGNNKGLVFIDVEEEDKDAIVGLHSEKLALAFGLISIPKGMTIRVMKNLRMCFNCHEAFKMISEIVDRDFVVRDLNRFHHFKNGSCTCGDFW
ncbi:hypothetical protein Sjap_007544 [Stephania japonica]|uniref:DYW domain-containing protein n=1 Tax=Stephania japonica TaxID=461633 RepID=A0AAP0JQ14_9MAGN